MLLVSGFFSEKCLAEEVKYETSGGTITVTNAPPGVVVPGMVPGGPPPGVIPGKPGELPGKPDKNKDKKPEEKPGEPKKPGEEGPKPLTRPTTPPAPPNPEEFNTPPDAAGRYRPQFRNQSWDKVLEWLAEKSQMSLDWQELPGDFLNLSTQRYYSVAELRSLINRHLLTRGYTLVCRDEMMTVLNLKNFDPSLVPRMTPEDLAERDPNEFVRVLFPLDWLTAEEAVKELDSLKSPNGRLTALSTTNQLEAMDAVVNLREIARFLRQGQSLDGQGRPFREFTLQYARADEVREQLIALLGLEKPATGMPVQPGMPGGPGGPGINPEQMRQMIEAQQRQHQGGGGKPNVPQPSAAKPGVYLVVNPRKNSLLAVAPPDKMVLIAKTIAALDVPADASKSLLTNPQQLRTYQLIGVDPEPVIKLLKEIGGLDPTTQLSVDKKNNIIAYASLADHFIIESLVKKLSGSERKFEVIPLRYLEADQVAGTILLMMGKEKKKETPSRRRYWWPDFSSSSESAEKPDEFQVDADVENNKLLLKANEVELAEVKNLLRKLGEILPEDGSRPPFRTLDAGSAEDAQELLEQVRRLWTKRNPLEELPAPSAEKQATEDAPQKESAPSPKSPPKTDQPSEAVRSARAIPWREYPVIPVAQQAEKEPPAAPAPAPPPDAPPVKISISPDGKIIISSDDAEALDLFENLAKQLGSPKSTKSTYEIIPLKYADAYNVALILEDFFREEGSQKPIRVPWYMADEFDTTKEEKPVRLSRRPTLKFISDTDTNSILVQGADAKRLQEVKRIIDFYDQPPKDAQTVRITKPIHLVHSKAKVVAETVKEVYRDLLSDKDKAFQGNKGQRDSGRSDWLVTIGGDGDSNSEQRTPKFKGLLSIGVDELSNTLIVSAPKFLFEDVHDLIKDLDQEAEPTADFKVVKIGSGLRGPEMQRALSEILGQEKARSGASGATAESPKNHPAAHPRRNRPE